MKTAKVLTEHLYRGKRRKVDDTYPIARADFPLLVRLGRIEIVTGEPELEKDYHIDASYRTTSMEAEPEPVKVKRKYTRKKVVE